MPSLEISFRLPYARVLSDEAVQEALVSLPVHATPQVLRLTVAGVLKRHAPQIQEGLPLPGLHMI